MGLNEFGELNENTIILDDGSVIFIDEHYMDDEEQDRIEHSRNVLKKTKEKYKTLNVFSLMDCNITQKEMFRYLCAMRIMELYGFIDGDNFDVDLDI